MSQQHLVGKCRFIKPLRLCRTYNLVYCWFSLETNREEVWRIYDNNRQNNWDCRQISNRNCNESFARFAFIKLRDFWGWIVMKLLWCTCSCCRGMQHKFNHLHRSDFNKKIFPGIDKFPHRAFKSFLPFKILSSTFLYKINKLCSRNEQ